MKNIHPVYHIKELMIKRELAKNPELAGENWDRFLPHFKKQCVKRKKLVAQKKKEKKEYTPFPPPQKPRDIDIKMETGEYFLSEQQQKNIHKRKKEEEKSLKKSEREAKRQEAFIPPEEDKPRRGMIGQRKKLDEGFGEKGSIDDLRNKFMKKKQRYS